jgi:hypothetical protein
LRKTQSSLAECLIVPKIAKRQNPLHPHTCRA